MQQLDSPSVIALIVVGLIALISLVAIVGGLLHARSGRLLAHAERMKALEMGRDLSTEAERAAAADPDQGAPRSPADQCYAVAGKACFWGFVLAVGASSSNSDSIGVAIAIAAATGAIGVTSVICGTVLAARGVAAPQPRPGSMPAKGYYDPEGV